mmetsp:Transcript_45189/g.59949  ORF Transcript_45189/g.59949 Transcript_45189/m.59949 type:complete len:84 (+) Transcript_45189:1023-1274(+)
MHSRVCNRELYKFYLLLTKLAHRDSHQEGFLEARGRAGRVYRELKASLRAKLDSGWTKSKAEYLSFTIEAAELAKFEEMMLTS